MRTAEQGDRVRVHYVIRSQDGSRASSRGRPPLELTVGVPHPRLPGLGLALVGMAPGTRKTITVAPQQAYGMRNPSRVRRCSPGRFPEQATLEVGARVRVADSRGRRHLVRVLQVGRKLVVVDTNHRWAGQTLQLQVKLISIVAGSERLPNPPKAVAFDLDAASLASLTEALPGWEIETVNGATPASVARAWDPRAVRLLVIGVRVEATATWELCRFLAFHTSFLADGPRGKADEASPSEILRSPTRSPDAPLLVLVPSGRDALVAAALEAGAHRCLVLPLHAAGVASVLAHARAGNQPGRHTLSSEQAQGKDRWRDDGGEG